MKIPASIWNEAMHFDEYIDLLEKLLVENKTTGPKQTPERLEKARLNLVRMKRLNQQIKPDENALQLFKNKPVDTRFIFIVEGWCGDAAQIVPVLNNLVHANGWDTRFILRDEHPEIMDLFLTNGTRSIPAIVAIDKNGTVLNGHWGPRPALLRDLIDGWKQEMDKTEWHKNMHTWYAKDKAITMQMDFAEWVKDL